MVGGEEQIVEWGLGEEGMKVTANGCQVLGGDENIPGGEVMAVQLCKYQKHCSIWIITQFLKEVTYSFPKNSR